MSRMVNERASVITRALLALLTVVLMAGCASAAVQRGALIGAGAGAAVGVTTGFLISDPDLLGSSESIESGNISLGTGESVAAGAIIGAVFGALVGAMIGHAADDEPVMPEQLLPPLAPTQAKRVIADAISAGPAGAAEAEQAGETKL